MRLENWGNGQWPLPQFSKRITQYSSITFHYSARYALLSAPMELLILAFLTFRIARRLLPHHTFCAMMKIDARVVIVLLLMAYLATGLGTLNLPLACIVVLCSVFLLPPNAVRARQAVSDSPSLPVPFLASIDYRGPPFS